MDVVFQLVAEGGYILFLLKFFKWNDITLTSLQNGERNFIPYESKL